MSKLIRVSTWQQRRFEEGEAPCPKVIREAIEIGEIPGKKIGGLYFVDAEAEINQTGNEYLDRILEV
ncbi:MAG: DNA-binding protein [Pseudomonadota bacterium]